MFVEGLAHVGFNIFQNKIHIIIIILNVCLIKKDTVGSVRIHETFAASVESKVVSKNHGVDSFRKLQYKVTFYTILKYDTKQRERERASK